MMYLNTRNALCSFYKSRHKHRPQKDPPKPEQRVPFPPWRCPYNGPLDDRQKTARQRFYHHQRAVTDRSTQHSGGTTHGLPERWQKQMQGFALAVSY